MTETTLNPVINLKERWATYQRENPGVRIRNAAAVLGVSEAELVATGCGEGVTRLQGGWATLLNRVGALGEVMALTRNDACVHEKHGTYHNVDVTEGQPVGLVLDEQIDLRLFMTHWHFGYAVETPWEGGRDGLRRSLQFFDQDGTAVHKIFLTRKSDVAAYEALVEAHRHEDQTPVQSVTALPEREPETPDAQIDGSGFLEAWANLEDTHDFFPLLKQFGVRRTQALRLAEGRFTERMDLTSVRLMLQRASETTTPIMVFVGSRGCIQIHTGPVRKLKEHGPWYNVLDPGFNLHLNETLVDAAWVVRKPTTDGVVTALEIFDAEGEVIALFFGKRKPGIPEQEAWREMVGTLPRLTMFD